VADSEPAPFRFAVVAAQLHDARSWKQLCRSVETAGYSSLYVPDTVGAQMGPIAALGAATAHTNHLGLGLLVANNNLRAPAVLAKELATLDVLSEGRLEWGIGAGWDPQDSAAAGVAFPQARVRVERMVEAVGLIQDVFGGDLFTHVGEHYTVEGLAGTPVPVQRPHPPLLVGAAEERMLRFAGERADIVNINRSFAAVPFAGRPPRKRPDEAVEAQIEWVRAASEMRRSPVEISIEANPPVMLGVDRASAAADLAKATGVSPELVLADPRNWVGSVRDVVGDLRRHRERWGISHWIVYEPYLHAAAPVVAELSGT
jgi:probable F420-dependent oxidoreductase